MKTIIIVGLSLLLTACGGGGDAPEVTINSVSHNGSGCPAGTSSIIFSSDKKTLSLSFGPGSEGGSRYEASAGYGSGVDEASDVSFDRVACSIAISLHVPSGYQAFLIGASYRGELSLPVDAKASFTREYFFAGSSGELIEETWDGELFNEEILFLDDLYADSVIYSGCGEDVILRANSSISVSAPREGDTAVIELDSFDYKNQQYNSLVDYHFAYKHCS